MPWLHIISTIRALVHPSFPPAWATACISQVSLKLVALRDGGWRRRKWEVGGGGSVKITYNEPCCWRNKRTWDGKSGERERWSRRKNINLSGISTPPSSSSLHFTTAAGSLYERLGENMQQGAVGVLHDFVDREACGPECARKDSVFEYVRWLKVVEDVPIQIVTLRYWFWIQISALKNMSRIFINIIVQQPCTTNLLWMDNSCCCMDWLRLKHGK